MPGGSAAVDGIFRNWAFDSSLSGIDYGIERRPYHRNCKCALHDKSRRDGNNLGRSCGGNCRNNTVSYKMRRSWSEGSLVLSAANGSGSGVGSSPSCSTNSSPKLAAVLARSISREELSSAGSG